MGRWGCCFVLFSFVGCAVSLPMNALKPVPYDIDL